MKVVKFLFKLVLWTLVVVLVALLAMPLWVGPAAKCVANVAAPKMLKTGFRLGHLSLNPYTARVEVGGLKLANPAGYSEEFAVTLGSAVFDVETLSLAQDTVHIEEITVKDVFVSYIGGGPDDVNNFKQIQYNLAGGKEKYEANQEAAKAAEASARAETQTTSGGRAVKTLEEDSSKKVIIDKLELSGVSLQIGLVPIRVPSLTIRDIGRDSGGATLEEAWQKIVQSVIKAAGVVGDQLKALGGVVGDAAVQVGETAGKAVDGAAKVVGETAGKAVDGAAKVVGDAAGSVGGAAKAVGEGASKTVGGAAKAVGEGASKALDSLKSLW